MSDEQKRTDKLRAADEAYLAGLEREFPALAALQREFNECYEKWNISPPGERRTVAWNQLMVANNRLADMQRAMRGAMMQAKQS